MFVNIPTVCPYMSHHHSLVTLPVSSFVLSNVCIWCPTGSRNNEWKHKCGWAPTVQTFCAALDLRWRNLWEVAAFWKCPWHDIWYRYCYLSYAAVRIMCYFYKSILIYLSFLFLCAQMHLCVCEGVQTLHSFGLCEICISYLSKLAIRHKYLNDREEYLCTFVSSVYFFC